MDQEREKQLREWLKKPEAKSLQTVLQSKLRLLQERALVECGKSEGENSYNLKSAASMKEAQYYQITMFVLDAITYQEGPFQILKFKP